MQAFTTIESIVVPLDRANVDTDQIIPKQFLKSIHRQGFGPNLFDEWRYLDQGYPGQDSSKRPINPKFVLNQPHYKNAQILMTGRNFGCGSSREHAPWALLDHGFRVILSPSFADIFFNNCFKNGILPIAMPEPLIHQWFEYASKDLLKLHVDLQNQTITDQAHGEVHTFEIEPFRKHCLLEGLDDIALTLKEATTIEKFEEKHKQRFPWLFSASSSVDNTAL
ncbi:MAG: 3-isopropylmalate dehydratase small subunit [Pseudomonadota bacterium]